MNPILITGATGLLGGNIVRQLCQQGKQVRVFTRHGADSRPFQRLDVERVYGDIRDNAAVRNAVRGAAAVIHSAGYVQISWLNEHLHDAINVEGTRHVAQAARDAGIRMVHVSSCDALPAIAPDQLVDEQTPGASTTQTPYARTKRLAEEVIRHETKLGLDAVIVNPAFMLGPWDWKPSSGKMLLAVASGQGLFPPKGWLSLCDARDVAAATIAALESSPTGRQFILAGKNLSYYEAWKAFAKLTNARQPIMRAGPLMVLLGGRGGDLLGRLMRREFAVNSAAFTMAGLPKVYSSNRAISELSYRIRPLEETVNDSWQWFLENGYADRRRPA